MVGYQKQPQRSRVAGSSARRARFSFAYTGMAIALLCLIASAHDGLPARAAPVTPAVAGLYGVPSHNRAYRASMIPSPDPIERNGSLTLTVQIRTAVDTPVEGAFLGLESWMPDNESVRVERPRAIVELGRGFYRVEGLHLDSPGWWNLKLQISAAGNTDSLAFNVVLP